MTINRKHSRFGVITAMLLSMFLTNIFHLSGQDTIPKTNSKTKVYKTWIILKGDFKHVGVLYSLSDSSVTISNYSKVKNQYYKQGFDSFLVEDIDMIKLRNANGVKKGAKIGLWTGVGVGFITGFIIGVTDETAGTEPTGLASFGLGMVYGLGGSFMGGLYGSAIGAGIGAIRIKIPIKGKRDNYYLKYDKLKKYAIVK